MYYSLTPAVVQGEVAYFTETSGMSAYALTTGSLLWSVALPAGSYEPALANGKAYAYRSGTLHEIDLVTGQVRKVIVEQYLAGLSGPSSRVVVSGAYAYIAGHDGLLKVDLATGARAWQMSGSFGWPVVVGDKLFVLSGGVLQMRSASSGALGWYWPQTSLGQIGDQLIVVGKHAFISDGAATRAIDIDTQQQVWMDTASGKLAISPNGILYIDSALGLVGVNLR